VGGFHADAWASHGIKFKPAERTTSENYLALLPLLTQPGRTRLLLGVSERPPSPNSSVKYIPWADAAGGTGKDSFALAIAHKETKDRIAVLDLVRERKPRFVAAAVVAEFVEILRRYRITKAASPWI
jgi:hypothetical protein